MACNAGAGEGRKATTRGKARRASHPEGRARRGYGDQGKKAHGTHAETQAARNLIKRRIKQINEESQQPHTLGPSDLASFGSGKIP